MGQLLALDHTRPGLDTPRGQSVDTCLYWVKLAEAPCRLIQNTGWGGRLSLSLVNQTPMNWCWWPASSLFCLGCWLTLQRAEITFVVVSLGIVCLSPLSTLPLLSSGSSCEHLSSDGKLPSSGSSSDVVFHINNALRCLVWSLQHIVRTKWSLRLVVF